MPQSKSCKSFKHRLRCVLETAINVVEVQPPLGDTGAAAAAPRNHHHPHSREGGRE